MLLLAPLCAALRSRTESIAEHLLLRHQVTVLTRPPRRRPRATPWSWQPTHLIRDRDAVYGGAFRARAEALGIATVRTPVRAPRANAVAERVIGTLRRECLDHVLPLDERHLYTVLAEYVRSSCQDRPHRTLRMETPLPQARPRAAPIQSIRSRPILGGLHHVYECAA
jgi:transposase InsO family protein